jgi:hypothetical protein
LRVGQKSGSNEFEILNVFPGENGVVFGAKRSSAIVLAAIAISFPGSGHREAESAITQPLASLEDVIPRAKAHARFTMEVGPSIPLPVEGMPQQLWASASPDDPDRLLVCTFEADSAHARLPSAAYVSLDSGNSWMRTLVDTHSDWVSETTCAAGTEGRAYFLAGVSDTSLGPARHERGSAEFYRSSDGGLTWMAPRRYPFIDWMTLAIPSNGLDTPMYLFGNHQATGSGDAGAGEWLERPRPMLISADGLTFSSPQFPTEPESKGGKSAFPLAAVVLDDGSALALFAEIPNPKFSLYKSDPNGYRLLSTIEMPANVKPYGPLSAHMARDPSGHSPGKLYAAIPAVESNHPVLVLASSEDGGHSWQSSVVLRRTAEIARDRIEYFYAGVAVNEEGVVGIEWFRGFGCPLFAISTDGGRTIEDSRTLGTCPGDDVLPSAISAYMKIYNDRSPLHRHIDDQRDLAPGFTIHVTGATLASVEIAADKRGRFHAFWSEPGGEGTRTFTAMIQIGSSGKERHPLAETEELTERSLIRVLSETFDPSTATFSIDASVRAIGSTSMAYPAFLEVTGDRSDCGTIDYLNPSGLSEDGHTVFRVPRRPDRERLFPGEDSLPVHIEVRVLGCERGHTSLVESARKRAIEVQPFFPLSVRFHVHSAHPKSDRCANWSRRIPDEPHQTVLRSSGLSEEPGRVRFAP